MYQSPFIFIHELGISPENYGLYFLAPAISYIVGGAIATILNKTKGVNIAISLGVIIFIISSLISLLYIYFTSTISVLGLTICMSFITIGISIIVPSSIGLALSSTTKNVGVLASIVSFMQFIFPALIGYVSGFISLSYFYMFTYIMLLSLLCLVSYFFMLKKSIS